ncbi:histone-lysine N-methyltransferase 2A isoform X4 [Pseudonaja textilis]|uniref:histone-lysine N-methyltransferase 2A isoform X4 n=1 Tax=Pseudonaja textilis TaxID=8673 RepID=UPI000EA83AAC|nr:histone-lysine N-methyltransferase 2A isoform X4 [Pseudonaja textilis]
MAHSGRWRFPARPGSGGWGRRGLGGCRVRVPALRSLRGDSPEERAAGGGGGGAAAAAALAGSGGGGAGGPSSAAAPSPQPAAPLPASVGVAPGFDAALQVSAAIGVNLRRFRAACGAEAGSGEDEQFLGFGSDDEAKGTNSPKSLAVSVKASARKPRGRPRNGSDRSPAALPESLPIYSPSSNPEPTSMEKIKRKEFKSGEKRRGRPPALTSVKFKISHKECVPDTQKGGKEEKENVKKIKRAPSATFQHAAKIKKLRTGKLSPLKSQFKSGKLQIGRKGIQIARRRGRPPSSDRLKTMPALVCSQLEKVQRARKEREGVPSLPKDEKPTVRQSPRRPVRMIPSCKRTDATIAKQLLQKAKKGAQKKMEKEAAKLQGRKGRTQLKNIRQFIMPVVSAISSRIIKTPKRFIEDEDYDPPIKIARLESTPNSRFSATSCESSEKSSVASQHSSQLSSDSSRSSSPSVDTSTDSQASEEMQALSEECNPSSEAHPSLPESASPDNEGAEQRRRRRFSMAEKNFAPKAAKKLPSLQSVSQQQSSSSSSSPPPPLLTPPPPLQPTASISDHAPWLMPPTIPLASPFLPSSAAAPVQEKRKSILREPTFRWTSLKPSRSEPQYFSSAKYAKEGLIRKPVFDNFRPPPLTPEDVGFAAAAAAAGFTPPGATAATRLFSPLHSGTRFDLHKRSPLLRAPRFTPSEAHSRIFESVTLPSSISRSATGSTTAAASSRKRKRRVFSPIRSESRSPSHSMRTRSGRLSTSELSTLPPSSSVSSSLTSISGGSLATSALNATTFTFPSHSLSQTGEATEKSQRPRKQTSLPAEPFPSSGPAPLFPWFAPGAQTERTRSKDKATEEVSKDKEQDNGPEKEKNRERDRDREKENKRESRKEKKKKVGAAPEIQSSSALFPSTRGSKGKVVVSGDAATSSVAKKPAGRRKPAATEPAADVPAAVLMDSASIKTKLPKKSRGGLEKSTLDLGLAASSAEREESLRLPAASLGLLKHSSISSVLAHADKLPMTDKRVASLLKKAKAQLYKIEKSKSLKQVDQPKGQGQESDSSETSVRGPRIKHVCRRAAVALGRKRAVFPDDMPTLSALPWEEREKILSSMGNDDKSSVAGSEDAEPLAPPIKPIKPVTRNKAPQEPPVKKGRRSRRCGQCPGCQVPEDCGVCTNCLDKPKFGGRNIKKQCCKMRKCQNLQWMPSKAYLQKQAKAVKKKEKKSKTGEKKDSHPGKVQGEPGQKAGAPPLALGKEDQASKRSSEPARKASEGKTEEGQLPPPVPDPKQPLLSATRKAGKQALPALPPAQLPSSGPPKKEAPKTVLAEPKKKAPPSLEAAIEQNRQKKIIPRPSLLVKQKPKEKEKPLPVSKPENSALNTLSTLSNHTPSKQKPLTDGVHRIRVDFKEDCEAESVWEMGGLGILTSIPITPRVVCFLCASSGNVEFVYCQVCCEPFHKFCLEVNERPLEDQLENWCCRRCRFCHVCGRQHQASKQLLECNKCRNSYHPECLGPNYPTKPTKKKKVWICTKCVRCKSCGATTPGKGWDAQWSHDFSLCHDCAKLFAKGNFCPLCDKCYDDDDYESKMMQCGKCDRWVHAKCEDLSDEMYEILSNLPESVAYTCINCTEQHPPEWRLALEKELQLSLKQVLTALLNSRTTSHLLRYRQAAKPPDLNPETEESVPPSQSSPKGPDPPILTEVGKQEEQPLLDLEGVKRKMDQGGYSSVLEFSDDLVKIIQAAINADGGQPELKKANSVVKSFFMRQMERVFPWFNVKKSRFWEPNKVTSNSGMLPNAVLPPSLDHNYAQWQEREENRSGQQQPPLMKKIIPAPKPRGPAEPNSPTPLHLPASPLSSPDRSQDDSPEVPPPPDVEDNRQCSLCLKYGDDGGNDAGRLLYIGQNEWTHVNCALWSAEVFEEEDGSLKNVHVAVIRGKQLFYNQSNIPILQRCEFCQKSGATVGCCLATCTSNYHFMCSRAKNCVFLEDKKVYCPRHKDLIKGETVPENGFEVLRRVFVDFEGISLRRKFLSGLEPENIHVMIGSMSIDCLGILNDLSDCEDKLFPVGYQCSRVYWSTTDARKRCVYTCKIMECRPPLLDSDINSTMEHDDNRTIVHSPVSLSAETPPRDGRAAPAALNAPSADLSPHSQNFKALRIRTPGFAPSQRTPGSRPLPSAGSPTPVPHEIVTVGDPLLSSGLRSIGSRRPSASLFSQPLRPWMLPPTRVGATNAQHSTISSGPSRSPVPEHNVSLKRTEHSVRPAALHVALQETFAPPSLATTSGGRGASPREGSLSFETGPSGGPFSAKLEKGKLLSLKDPSASCGNSKTGCHGQGISGPEGNPSKGGKLLEASSALFSPKESIVSAVLHQNAPKKEQDRHLTQTDKNCLYETPEAKISPFSSNRSPCMNDPVSSVGRERRQKMKKGTKERHSSKLFRSLSVLPSSHKECAETEFVHQAMTSEHINQQQYNSIAVEKLIDNNVLGQETPKASFQSEMAASKDLQNSQKRTVKVTLTPLKMEGETQSKNVQKEREAESQPKRCPSGPQPASVPERSGSDCIVPDTQSSASCSVAPSDPSYPNLPVQDSGLMIQDGAKEQEDGSYKRRYPRRSARARSNMFFGLTPLYGVRSYGEEDLPFYSNSTGKKRGRRSAEGQVDGADDLSTSDEEDLYYYNFTRTVVSSSDEHMASHSLFREEEQISLPKISQLDGVDDGTESDASTTITTRKINSGNKRSGKENGTESLKLERSEDSGEKMQATKTSVGHKTADPKMENCRVKSQDSLEAQLSSLEAVSRRPRTNTEPSEKNLLDTFSPELLKSDSDNNNSDDCGNILPSDIMDFVLKNTPSMQALGESPESSSSELLTLGEGLGLDSNRGKDMALFEVFSQQLPTAEPVDSSVSSSISAEEQFELPLELPSDLSVLTTRSPAVPSQNHGRLAVIPEPSLAASGERSMLTLPSSDPAEKRVTVTEKVSSGEAEPALLSPQVAPSPEGSLTPDPFIQGHLEAEHLASPPCGPREAGLAASQDLPVSPSLPLQNPKYGPSAPDKPGPSPISTAAVQSSPLHLKAAAEKLLVVNQNMQPLYVLQTLPNGLTQKIQLTSPVSSGPAGMEAGASVLGPMDTASLALAAGLSPALPSARPLFPASSKGLRPVAQQQQQQQHLHSFSPSPASGSTGFPAALGSAASSLLIGVQQLPDPEANPRADIGPAVTTPPTGLGKKRPIARLHSRRAKKSSPSAAAPSDLASMNFPRSSPPGHPGLLDLGAACPRTGPSMVKRSKPGLMYFEQAPLLPQEVGTAATEAALGASPSIASPPPGLNVAPLPAPGPGPAVLPHLLGQGGSDVPGISDMNSLSSLLIKATRQGLSLSEQPASAPPPASRGFPPHKQVSLGQSASAGLATAAVVTGISVLPPSKAVSADAGSAYQAEPPLTQLLACKAGPAPPHLDLTPSQAAALSDFPQLMDTVAVGRNRPAPCVPTASPGGSPSTVLGPTRAKSKVKRLPSPLGSKGSGKKPRAPPSWNSFPGQCVPPQGTRVATQDPGGGPQPLRVQPDEATGVLQPAHKSAGHLQPHPQLQPTLISSKELERADSNAEEEEEEEEEEEGSFSSPLMFWLQQERKRKESLAEKKPKKGLVFEISSDDGFQICAESMEEAWKSLTDKVQEARSNARLKQLSFAGVSGLQMLGILHHAVVFLIEQLCGAKHCSNYKFRFHKPEEAKDPPVNPHGSARAEGHLRKPGLDLFNFLASKHRQPPQYNPNEEEEEEVQLKSARRATSMDLPMPMRFRHLRKTSKEAVGVYRSPIHGRGLFCKRNIDAGEMVIEYAGNVIRSILTDKREKYYDSKGIGCYMFRIDDTEVVDATMHGNAARFINHSCEPNCYSRVINIDGQKHIVIFAMRKIYRGEELTYDYKFPIEDARNKLPCNCGAKKCRHFLN